MQTITIALVGQPNVGKSSLINAISGANLKVGNFSGVTIEKTQTTLQYKGYTLHFIDLPGLYSLSQYSLEESITTNFLHHSQYDIIVNVLDSTNLARNLALSLQLLSLTPHLLLALNMSDEAQRENLSIDSELLAKNLGVECIPLSAKAKHNIPALLEGIMRTYERKRVSLSAPHMPSPTPPNFRPRKFIAPLIQNARTSSAHDERDSQDSHALSTQAINLAKLCTTSRPKAASSLTRKLDSILLHKFLGLPIFLASMWCLFQTTFTLGEYPKEWIESSMDSLAQTLKEHIPYPELGSLLGDGIIAGVGAVLSFLPHILILFLGIVLLESTGYMARVAYLLDGILRHFGLHGKSFIPLVSGFGCSVPAFMATRTLQNPIDKLLTLFIINFMSCSARLPIYTLFVGIFFSAEVAGSVLFGIYILGAVMALVSAKLLRLSVFRGKSEPFVLEIPKYRLPSLNLVLLSVLNKAKMYVKKAGGFILLASMLIWFGTNYPKNDALTQNYEAQIALAHSQESKDALSLELESKLLEQSFLGRVGEAMTPIFAPMEFDWRLCISLLNGLAAKEVVVSSMGVLYALGEGLDESSASLQEAIRASVSFPTAIAFILFVMFYNPCLAATIIFTKEAGGWRYSALLFVFTSVVAYICAFVGYVVASLGIG
ncbi:ferrous iron transport protein B [uncultured Helicobacter sp.]|uniref:ferrous iron transport protein B n=1 Tax=uncultured Helicobacter sp. TaxID=175537 RepID=UPI0037527515